MVLFHEASRVVEIASKRRLEAHDLPTLHDKLSSRITHGCCMRESLERMTEGTQHEHKHPWITSSDHTTQVSTALSQLLWLTLRSFFADFACLTGLKLLIVAFAFVPAIFLNALVTQMAEENSE